MFGLHKNIISLIQNFCNKNHDGYDRFYGTWLNRLFLCFFSWKHFVPSVEIIFHTYIVKIKFTMSTYLSYL